MHKKNISEWNHLVFTTFLSNIYCTVYYCLQLIEIICCSCFSYLHMIIPINYHVLRSQGFNGELNLMNASI